MDDVRFLRVKELFARALAWPAAERDRLLDEACAGDPELRREVADLLAHASQAGAGFLAAGAAVAGAPLELEPLSIPGFRVLERLGAGGSGTVYRAEQERPRREVALKVLRLDALGPGQVARFEREAAILASLDHPGIARVIEAGVLDQGSLRLPWLALEFVRGSTLDEFARDRQPAWRDLVALHAEVCDAVEHAHARGIVHRDLKPSNVMIDESGRPRVLDFGVARALEGASDVLSQLPDPTRTGMLVGTIAYMAPEQASGERLLVPAVDVHALGVMLFELLTDELPLATDGLDLVAVVHALCEEEPTPLRRLRPDLPADLGTILAKTLEKDAARRYRSAGGLAADLRRLLAHEPVLARPATALYRTRKFVRRNGMLTGATLAVVVALASGLAVALASLREAQEQIARHDETLGLFAGQILTLAPRLGFGEEKRPDLEKVLALFERQLESTPGTRSLRAGRAGLLYELGSLDQARGDHAAMRARLEVARAAREELVREDPADLESWTHLSMIYAKLGEAARDIEGDVALRDEWFGRALALDERLVREHPGDLELIEDLGWSLERVAHATSQRGDHEQGLRLYQRRLADAEELVAREPGNWKYLYNLAHAHFSLGSEAVWRGDLADAARHHRENVGLSRKLYELQPERRVFLDWLVDSCRAAANVLNEDGRSKEALPYAEEALARAEELVLGDPQPKHTELLCRAAGELADLQRAAGAPEAALQTARDLRNLAQRLGRSRPSLEPAPFLTQAASIENAGR